MRLEIPQQYDINGRSVMCFDSYDYASMLGEFDASAEFDLCRLLAKQESRIEKLERTLVETEEDYIEDNQRVEGSYKNDLREVVESCDELIEKIQNAKRLNRAELIKTLEIISRNAGNSL